MSVRVVGYEGEGRLRRPRVVDEGPSSAAATDPISMHANGGLQGLALLPTGGAGPVERRVATPEEIAAARAREAKPASPIAPRPRPLPVTAQEEPVEAVTPPAEPETEPALTHGRHCPCSACAREDWTNPALADCGMHGPSCPRVYAPFARQPEPTTPNARLHALADAAVAAATAWTAREIAIGAWRTAQADLEAAIAAVSGPGTPSVSEPAPDIPETIPEPTPIRPGADGGRATAEQLQQSRRNGQAAMQAQRRAVELTSAAAAKAEASGGGPEPMPAYQRRILDELIRSNGDRPAAAAALGYKPTSLVGSLGPIRKRTDLTEIERAAISSRRS